MLGNFGEKLKIILQADGASRGNPGPAAFGAVILDENRNLLKELFAPLGEQTNNFAEYSAVIAGLEFISNNYSSVSLVIEMDSKLVIEQLAGRWKVNSSTLQELRARAFTLLAGMDYELVWIPREQNSLADSAANKALDGVLGTVIEIPEGVAQPRSIRANRQTILPTTIVLVRHGHTEHTEQNLISGSQGEDPALSALGLAEASAAAEEVNKLLDFYGLPSIYEIYHSPQQRARETAQSIAHRNQIRLKADPRLKEIGFGDWEAVSMDEIESRNPELVSKWRESATVSPPNGESINELELRVGEALREIILGNQGKTIGIVTHMMPCRAIAKKALATTIRAHWSIQFAPASISIFRFYGMEFAESFVINSCGHLLQR